MHLGKGTKSDLQPRSARQVKSPPGASEMDLVTPEERKIYVDAGSTWNTDVQWAEGRRRLGADKSGHVDWVCYWRGGSVDKIDSNRLRLRMMRLLRPDYHQPYHAHVAIDQK